MSIPYDNCSSLTKSGNLLSIPSGYPLGILLGIPLRDPLPFSPFCRFHWELIHPRILSNSFGDSSSNSHWNSKAPLIFPLRKHREERTEEWIPGFILILTNTKSWLFWADKAAYNNHATLTYN